MSTKVEFFNNEYMASHGTLPRGRGSWAFQLCFVNSRDGKGAVHFSPGGLTLTEAKRWIKPIAIKEATNYADPHHIGVEVLP
jgi:hypothetical protein